MRKYHRGVKGTTLMHIHERFSLLFHLVVHFMLWKPRLLHSLKNLLKSWNYCSVVTLLTWQYIDIIYYHCLHDLILFTNHIFLNTYAFYSNVYVFLLCDLYRNAITYLEHVFFFFVHFLLSCCLSFSLHNLFYLHKYRYHLHTSAV